MTLRRWFESYLHFSPSSRLEPTVQCVRQGVSSVYVEVQLTSISILKRDPRDWGPASCAHIRSKMIKSTPPIVYNPHDELSREAENHVMSFADPTVSAVLFSLLSTYIHTYTRVFSGLNEEMGEGAMKWENTAVRLNHLFGTPVKTEADVEMLRWRTRSQQSVWSCSRTVAEEDQKSRCTSDELCSVSLLQLCLDIDITLFDTGVVYELLLIEF